MIRRLGGGGEGRKRRREGRKRREVREKRKGERFRVKRLGGVCFFREMICLPQGYSKGPRGRSARVCSHVSLSL